MMHAKHFIAAATMIVCVGCATPERIVLLPDASGKQTAIEVAENPAAPSCRHPMPRRLSPRAIRSWEKPMQIPLPSATPM